MKDLKSTTPEIWTKMEVSKPLIVVGGLITVLFLWYEIIWMVVGSMGTLTVMYTYSEGFRRDLNSIYVTEVNDQKYSIRDMIINFKRLGYMLYYQPEEVLGNLWYLAGRRVLDM